MDPVSISIGLGLATSVLLAEMFGLVAGGMVVPGYLALFLDQPLVIATTLGAAFFTWGLVRFISRFVIVYGRRRTALMILTGFFLRMAFKGTLVSLIGTNHLGPFQPADFAIVGHIVPGLIAIWIDRQGWAETFCVVLIASALVRLLLISFAGETFL